MIDSLDASRVASILPRAIAASAVPSNADIISDLCREHSTEYFEQHVSPSFAVSSSCSDFDRLGRLKRVTRKLVRSRNSARSSVIAPA